MKPPAPRHIHDLRATPKHSRRRVEDFATPQLALPGQPETPLDGDAIGGAWERHVDAALERHALIEGLAGRPAPLYLVTQPKYVGGAGRARPAGKGWVDRVLCLAGGVTVHLELKAVVRQGDHTYRWTLPPTLRLDLDAGHQARRLRDLACLGHRAAVLLGVQEPARLGVWAAVYLIPVSGQGLPRWGSQASATWAELERYKVGVDRWVRAVVE